VKEKENGGMTDKRKGNKEKGSKEVMVRKTAILVTR
jgi:hypothetical protein